MVLRKRLMILRIAPLLAGLALAGPADAWKPRTHIYLAELARRDAIDGRVTIYEVEHVSGRIVGELGQFEVDPKILPALRDSAAQFRAGVVGPDAYPDMVTGQQLIHPGTNPHILGDPTYGELASAPGTDAWLTHLWRIAYGRQTMSDAARTQMGGGVAGTLRSGSADGHFQTPAIRAFVVGYVTHAAGDMFMHTFVNHYTGGDFALQPDPRNAVKHIVLEGYVGTRTQRLGQGMGISINGVDDFIHLFMVAGRPGTILYDHLMQGAGAGTSFPAVFSALRANLQRDVDEYERARLVRKGPERVAYAMRHGPEAEYKKAWIDDIDKGLRAWPVTSHLIAQEIIYNEQDSMNLSEAKFHATDFMWKHGFSMMGVPDAVVTPINWVRAVLAALPSPFQALIDAIKEALLDWAVKTATGMSPDELSSYLKDPAHHFDAVMNSPGGGYGGRSETRVTLAEFNRDVLKIDDPSTEHPDLHFHPYEFAPAFNTIQMTKIAFLSEKGMADLRAAMKAKGVDTPPAAGRFENAMLGFLTSIDGDNRWQQAAGQRGQVFARGNAAAWRMLFKRQIGEGTASPRVDRPVAEKPDEASASVTPAQLEALKAIEGDYLTNASTLLTLTVDGGQVVGRAVTRAVGRHPREQLALTLTPGNELQGTWLQEIGQDTTRGQVTLRFAADNMSFAGRVQTNPSDPAFEYRGERVKSQAAAPEAAAGDFREAGYFALRVDAAGRPKGPRAAVEVAMTARNAQGGRRGLQYNDNTFIVVGSDGVEYRSDGNFYGKSSDDRLNATVWLAQDEQAAVTYVFPGMPAGVSPVRLVVRDRTQIVGEFSLTDLPVTRPAPGASGPDTGDASADATPLEGFSVQVVSAARGTDRAWEAVVVLRNTGAAPLPLSRDMLRIALLDAAGDTRQATGDLYEPDGPARRPINRLPTLEPGGEVRVRLMFPESGTMTPNRYTVGGGKGGPVVRPLPAS